VGRREFIPDTSSSSALPWGQELLVIVWKARMICHVRLQATITEISSYMIFQSYWQVYHWQSEHECCT
jgi:hypothetical protein